MHGWIARLPLLFALLAIPGCLVSFDLSELPRRDASSDAACAAGLTACGTTCVSTETDLGNCGGCGMACAPSSFGCAAGVCETLRTLNWTTSSNASQPTQTAMAVAGSAESERFDYMASGMQVYAERDFTFTAFAGATRSFSFSWVYTGYHAYFMATAGLQAFADGPTGRMTVDLVPAGTTTSGGFMFSGTATITVTAGQTFGFVASGVNYDSDSRLMGTVTITAD